MFRNSILSIYSESTLLVYYSLKVSGHFINVITRNYVFYNFRGKSLGSSCGLLSEFFLNFFFLNRFLIISACMGQIFKSRRNYVLSLRNIGLFSVFGWNDSYMTHNIWYMYIKWKLIKNEMYLWCQIAWATYLKLRRLILKFWFFSILALKSRGTHIFKENI